MGVGAKVRLMKERKSFKAGEIIGNSNWRESTSFIRRSNSLSTEVGNNEATIIQQKFTSEKSMKKNEAQISEIVRTVEGYLATDKNKNKKPTHVKKSRKICRVPNNLRELHKQGFDPKLVSIGPFHRHMEHLIPMEEHKIRLLSSLLTNMKNDGDQNQNGISAAPSEVVVLESIATQQQSGPAANTNSNKIRCLVAAMKELEANARACYSDTFEDFGPNEFVMMMLLDGCFVVQLLQLYAKCDREGVNDDPMFSSRWMLPNLQHDLLMFENQLPFTVIEKIFELTYSDNESCSLADLTLKFFDSLLPRTSVVLNKCSVVLNKCSVDIKPHHLLGLFRSSFLLSFKSNRLPSSVQQAAYRHHKQMMMNDNNVPSAPTKERHLIHCVTELKEAGIVFKKRENYDLLDIEFKNGNLWIPPLLVDDHTGPVFLNFVAYEQCNLYSEPYFTHYLLFIDSLVNSSRDVEHLHYKEIIDHLLGCDEDVANLFNKLCKEVVHDINDCYLSEPLKEVNRYFRIKRHKWWAKWKHDYFSTPWAFTSFLAAIFLLILTSIQTFFAIFAYIRPAS